MATENTRQPSNDAEYQALSEVVPERELESLEVEEESGGEGGDGNKGVALGGLSKQMSLSSNLSDMQSSLAVLFPEFIIKYLNYLPVARILPEQFVPLLRWLTKKAIREFCPKISVTAIRVMVYAALTQGIDGEGRIDVLAVAGAAKALAEKEMDKKAMAGIT